MDAQEHHTPGACVTGEGDGGPGAVLQGGAVEDFAEERFAGHSERKGPVLDWELVEGGEQLEVVLEGFSKADSRVEQDLLGGDALGGAGLEGGEKKRAHLRQEIPVGGVVLHRCGSSLHVHGDGPRAGLGEKAAHGGILEAPDVVHHGGAGLECGARDGRFAGVDGEERAGVCAQALEDGPHPVPFLLLRNLRRARAGGFATDVDEIGSFADHLESVSNGAFGIAPGAAVGEGIRGDVEHAHEEGALAQIKNTVGDFPKHGDWEAPRKRPWGERLPGGARMSSLGGMRTATSPQPGLEKSGNPYETDRLLNEYLLFHYGSEAEVLPYPFGPREALGYAVRCVRECVDARRVAGGRALDLGCAVGRSSFELARDCGEVVGVDYSQRFVDAAEAIRVQGELPYFRADEGELGTRLVARRPEGVEPGRVRFERGDAQELREGLGKFDVVLMANLIDRLGDPERCLRRAREWVRVGGQLVVTSPYTWMSEYTPQTHWLGGTEREGGAVRTLDGLGRVLAGDFALEMRRDLPFLIREHARKFQWSVAEATVWRRLG
jgi:putative 4-mercaptohistidine N1-methyltranferase